MYGKASVELLLLALEDGMGVSGAAAFVGVKERRCPQLGRRPAPRSYTGKPWGLAESGEYEGSDSTTLLGRGRPPCARHVLIGRNLGDRSPVAPPGPSPGAATTGHPGSWPAALQAMLIIGQRLAGICRPGRPRPLVKAQTG